jgi:hypothetical protein
MNISDNKKITDFLHGQGYQPVSIKGSNWWYMSPLRNERTASFKVDVNKNLWYDFGFGKGGDLRTLVKLLCHDEGFVQFSNHSAGTMSYVPWSKQPVKNTDVAFTNIETMVLANRSLLYYLKGRGISENVAFQYCKEVHYTNHGKRYFAVGFANHSGGYEIRNAYFKGCISPKDISVIAQGRDCCHVFEGFIDFLSYVELHGDCDAIVLNSVINVPKALDVLSKYQKVYCHLDNDEAGRNATRQIMESCAREIIDASHEYVGYKDINEFLCRKTEHRYRR